MWRTWCLLLFAVACCAETVESDAVTLALAINAVAVYRKTTPIVDEDIASCLVRLPYECGADGCVFATDPSIIPVKEHATTISSCIRVLGRYWDTFEGSTLRGIVFVDGGKVVVCMENDDPAISHRETLYIDIERVLDHFKAKPNEPAARNIISLMSLSGGVVCLTTLCALLVFLIKRR